MASIELFNNRIIEDYGKPYIIAELGSNHNGDMDIARRMIYEAKQAGCNCVKFQSWSKDTIFSKKVYKDNYFLKDDYRNRKDFTLEQIVDKFSISEIELYDMKKYCDELEIDMTSTPFSRNEVDFLVDVCNVPFIKIASMDLTNYPFLRYIAKKNLPILLATGLSEASEIDKAIRTIETEGNRQICILHCISVYPPKHKDINLNNILGLRSSYPEYPIGFSDHSLGVEIPTAAVALGACVIEKHFTIDKDMFGWDHKISADFNEMRMLVTNARNVQLALGSTRRNVNDEEKKKRDAFRRSIVYSKNLPSGSVLHEEDLDFKRPGTGVPPEMLYYFLGKVLKRDVVYDDLLIEEDIL